MEYSSMRSFLIHYEKTRQITRKFVDIIPPGKIDWAYMPHKFSLGDLIRHIAAIERYVFAEMVSGRPSSYTGCGKNLADGYPDVVDYFHRMHEESIAIFQTIPDTDLSREIRTLTGSSVSLSVFLNALITHEVHHRAALCIYLNLLGVETPPVIGLKEEQVIELSRQQKGASDMSLS